MIRGKRPQDEGVDETVSVRIAAGFVLYVDGVGLGEGELVELPAQEAEWLVEDGQAERVE